MGIYNLLNPTPPHSPPFPWIRRGISVTHRFVHSATYKSPLCRTEGATGQRREDYLILRRQSFCYSLWASTFCWTQPHPSPHPSLGCYGSLVRRVEECIGAWPRFLLWRVVPSRCRHGLLIHCLDPTKQWGSGSTSRPFGNKICVSDDATRYCIFFNYVV